MRIGKRIQPVKKKPKIVIRQRKLKIPEWDRELSNSLWLPVNLTTEPLRGNKEKILNNTWFDTIKQTSPGGITNPIASNPQQTNGENIRIHKYQLNLTKEDKDKWKSWFHATRFVYNKCVEWHKANPTIRPTTKILRHLCTTKSYVSKEILEKIDGVADDVLDGALMDFIKAYNIQEDLYQRRVWSVNKRRADLKAQGLSYKHIKDAKGYEMKFRKRKNLNSIVIPHRKILRNDDNSCYCFPRLMGDKVEEVTKRGEVKTRTIENKTNLSCKKQIPPVTKDSRLVYDGFNFTLHVPVAITPIPVQAGHVCSLDPGVRTFQTVYGTDGVIYSVGNKSLDDQAKIAEKCRHGFRRDETKAPNKNAKRNLMKKAALVEKKIKNKMDDLHHKLSKFLTTKYKTIIIPNFNVSVLAYKSKMSHTNKRKMYRWGHFRFRSLLINKGVKHGCNVLVGTEEYTSKTCGNCFKIKWDLGDDKVHYCSGKTGCGTTMGRDINGARNIMMLNWNKFELRAA